MKKITDYIDPMMVTEKYIALSDIDYAWACVLRDRIKEIEMNDVVFFAFVRVFMHQFPHDWDQKKFMNVVIHRTI